MHGDKEKSYNSGVKIRVIESTQETSKVPSYRKCAAQKYDQPWQRRDRDALSSSWYIYINISKESRPISLKTTEK